MNRSKIEWTDYSINPVKGLCPVACSYCYARRMYKRFKWNPEIRWEPEHLLDLNLMPSGSKVFIGSTIELFGDWIKEKWLQDLFYWWIPRYPQHTFIFLTKRPENLIKWSPFPGNVWVGVSATNKSEVLNAVNHLFNHRIASTQFLSIEPLLQWDMVDSGYPFHSSISKKDLDWLVIGQQTPIKQATMPKIGWIQEILVAAHNAGDLPVFLKDNLRPLIEIEWPGWKMLQEFPVSKPTG